MNMRRALAASLAAALPRWRRGCGGDDDEAAAAARAAASAARRITVWTNEGQPDRITTRRRSSPTSRAKTGVKTKLVARPRGPALHAHHQRGGGRQAARRRRRHARADSRCYAQQEIFDPDAAQEVVDKLGADTFSKKALDLVSQDGKATGVPSDGWGQLLIYRKDLFEKAGLEAPKTLRGRPRRGGEAQRAPAWPASCWPPRPATASPPRRSSTSRWRWAASSSTTAAT